MTALEFYKFINDNNIEYHWEDNIEIKERDVIFFPYYFQMEDMRKIMSASDFDDKGIRCTMKDGYFAIWASEILGPNGIELTEIFGKDVS